MSISRRQCRALRERIERVQYVQKVQIVYRRRISRVGANCKRCDRFEIVRHVNLIVIVGGDVWSMFIDDMGRYLKSGVILRYG